MYDELGEGGTGGGGGGGNEVMYKSIATEVLIAAVIEGEMKWTIEAGSV